MEGILRGFQADLAKISDEIETLQDHSRTMTVKLKNRTAAEKIREFLLKKIESLRAPNTNICIIQQNILLKFKELYWFLMERYSEAALELRSQYIVTVSNYFHASFEKYLKSIAKIPIKDKTNVFTLGDRVQVLSPLDTGIILGYIAEEQKLVSVSPPAD
ncbi:hypothetical protein HK101_005021 [Irineochytrium annulatum]|nr:hypothetical protein HK101_005021 [Irineochytrium annulatum]